MLFEIGGRFPFILNKFHGFEHSPHSKGETLPKFSWNTVVNQRRAGSMIAVQISRI